MTILIKGMEMPENCAKCPICASMPLGDYAVYHKCVLLNRLASKHNRRYDCPLVPVPTPHGRLIDEKWIKEYITDTIKGFEEMNRSDLQNYSLIAGLRTVEVMIEHAPTVIEAEEG